jgi:catechol 2,3-dioxygenase-like lactoylglutathione lyase family enzyme
MLAVHSVDEFVLSVPRLDEATHFYRSFGLDVREDAEGIGLYTYGHPHRWARVVPGERKRLLWVSLGIHPEDAPLFEQRLQQYGVMRIDAPAGAAPDGMWIEGPDGLALQLRVADKCSPSEPAARELTPVCCNVGRAPGRSQVQGVRPLHLSHILLFTVDVGRTVEFFVEVLGLCVSDRSGDVIAFLHTPHGSDHHLIAFAKSEGPGLHHSSWCVTSIDAVGLGAMQMAEAGYVDGWGVGRHVLGSNYFCYVQDPWGSYAEYSYDIDFVRAGESWPAADHRVEDALYVWGPPVPERFVYNGEIESV